MKGPPVIDDPVIDHWGVPMLFLLEKRGPLSVRRLKRATLAASIPDDMADAVIDALTRDGLLRFEDPTGPRRVGEYVLTRLGRSAAAAIRTVPAHVPAQLEALSAARIRDAGQLIAGLSGGGGEDVPDDAS